MRKIYLPLLVLLFVPTLGLAHSGGTASDGCHYCRTNCSTYGYQYNTRHCHNGGTRSYTSPTKSQYVRPLYSQETVRFIQTRLNAVMGASLEVDGVFGASTRAALTRFQREYGLSADGIYGNKTHGVLQSAEAHQKDDPFADLKLDTSAIEKDPSPSPYVAQASASQRAPRGNDTGSWPVLIGLFLAWGGWRMYESSKIPLTTPTAKGDSSDVG